MTTKFSFKFTLKISPSLNNNLPPEVAKAFADGFTLMASWRKYRGLTQEDIAKRVGIPTPTYGNHERKMNKPPEKTLQKIASALHIDISQLAE